MLGVSKIKTMRKRQDFRGNRLEIGSLVSFVHPLKQELMEGLVKGFTENQVLVSHSIDGVGKYERKVPKTKIVKM